MFDTVPLIELAAKAAGADARLASDDELCAAALGFEQARRRLDAAEAHELAEPDTTRPTTTPTTPRPTATTAIGMIFGGEWALPLGQRVNEQRGRP